MNAILKILFFGFLPTLFCKPFHENHSGSDSSNFIGHGTSEIATALLQGFVEKEDNMVYSPFGYSAILAIFSEGAKGTSRDEIATALHFPKDVEAVRMAYHNVLERFVEKKNSNSPEFKNWFYIYKNYSINEELQNVLRKYYLTEIKYVDRPEDYVKEPKTAEMVDVPQEKTLSEKPLTLMDKIVGQNDKRNKRDVSSSESSFEEANLKKAEDKTPPVTDHETSTEDSSGKENLKDSMTEEAKEPAIEDTKEPMSEEETKEPMKEEEEEKKEEKPNKTDENLTVKQDDLLDLKVASGANAQVDEVMKPENSMKEETKEKDEKIKEDEKIISESTKETVEPMEPIKVNVESEMTKMEHFSGMTDSSIKIKGKETRPQMIIFNGLYYKGEWETPFERKPADSSRVFYKSEKEKIFVPTIHSQGLFNAGDISTLDSKAIELPYKGGRYSLLILVPNARNGLTKLISDLSGYPLSSIYDQLTEKLVDVSLPCFEINTISKPISSLRKLGVSNVTSIFNPETADLSGISGVESGLYVEELVQMVTFRVEAEYSKANFLTASIASSRSNVQNFQVNQPFLFYLRDNLEDIIIVNGKVVDPTPKSAFYFS